MGFIGRIVKRLTNHVDFQIVIREYANFVG